VFFEAFFVVAVKVCNFLLKENQQKSYLQKVGEIDYRHAGKKVLAAS